MAAVRGRRTRRARFAFGSLMAAIIVVAVTERRPGMRRLATRMLRWRVGWRWYVIALGLPISVDLLASTINHAFGAPIPAVGQAVPWYTIRLVHPIDGPVSEEPGSRGYALPRLQHTRSRSSGSPRRYENWLARMILQTLIQ